MASNNVLKLANRIKEEFNIDVLPETHCTTRTGRHLKAAGAFLWTIHTTNYCIIGGCEPMRKYLPKRNFLEIEDCGFREYELWVYTPSEVGYEKKGKSD